MNALIRVTGAVQGIGYRPFVAELATKYELKGEVKNLGGIVEIIVLGDEENISSFYGELKKSSPSGSIVINVSLEYLKENEPEGLIGYSGFRIVESSDNFEKSYLPVFPPDIAICDKCLEEMHDEQNRRFGYPLISCASCGPRFSILRKLPYDRKTTTMDVYCLCPECNNEYQKGRRRHAQTISCHSCGPQLIFDAFDSEGKDLSDTAISEGHDLSDTVIIDKAARIIQNGGIIGIKGIGGYQLAADPYNYEAVKKLREIKGREQKPFAVMFSSVSEIKRLCKVSEKEEEFLLSSAKPIVLLDKKNCDFSENVCGNSGQIGAFLPSSGLHVLLTEKTGPLIVTSGNISGEPMIIADDIFRDRFSDKIDGVIWYKRDILRPLDDSVIQMYKDSEGNDEPRFIRRARGYVPLPLFLNNTLYDGILFEAYGADLKNTFSIGYGDRIITSQFLGDMEDYKTVKLQKNELKEFCEIFRVDNLEAKSKLIICDKHPGYHTTELADSAYKAAETVKTRLITIQHHHAHIGSVMAEHGLKNCIGVAFDGTGYGTDKTIWGSEFLVCNEVNFLREGHLKPIRIVGQDEGMKNAAISAVCYLLDSGLEIPRGIMDDSELTLIRAALANNINAYPNSGMGRLFDAVSCILGICSYNSYEGECAVRLQNAAEKYSDMNVFSDNDAIILPIKISDEDNVMDVTDMLKELLSLRDEESRELLAYSFHKAIAEAVKRIAINIRSRHKISDICLSGGVFANRLLLYLCDKMLKEEGFVVYYNRILPTNDGGISAGQVYLANLMIENS
ncbi:carbamoyltransferase HypF [Butyrivibrio sp. JL13D10]|uniref:carbamoyltransferase HypF n=1 Tax=Butyrivibrio sp. JL13D10 TaxID=3236815 RepID=UPI0038B62768